MPRLLHQPYIRNSAINARACRTSAQKDRYKQRLERGSLGVIPMKQESRYDVMMLIATPYASAAACRVT